MQARHCCGRWPWMASIARSTRPGPGTSNGGLTAHPRGDRWSWESRIFGGAYDQVPADQRPKYGALNFRRRPAGGSPRFGSAHFRLNGDVLARTTFCYSDSVFDPVDFGVASAMSLLEKAERDDRDVLDDYIEAQVHGPVVLTDDVEALVLDSCHRGTEVEWLAAALPCPVEWHDGFRLSISEMGRHPAYRGRADRRAGKTPRPTGLSGRAGSRRGGQDRDVRYEAGRHHWKPLDVERVCALMRDLDVRCEGSRGQPAC